MTTNLTTHFTLEEFLRSRTAKEQGIDNTPNEAQIRNMGRLCKLVLEDVRLILDKPMVITSGFRCPELNKAIRKGKGGAKKSAHMDGRAADFKVHEVSPQAIFDIIVKQMRTRSPVSDFLDKIIYEGNWTHIQIRKVAKAPRRQAYIAKFNSAGEASYRRVV